MSCELCDDTSIVWIPHCLCKEEEFLLSVAEMQDEENYQEEEE